MYGAAGGEPGVPTGATLSAARTSCCASSYGRRRGSPCLGGRSSINLLAFFPRPLAAIERITSPSRRRSPSSSAWARDAIQMPLERKGSAHTGEAMTGDMI